jgi:thioredoxin-related protein
MKPGAKNLIIRIIGMSIILALSSSTQTLDSVRTDAAQHAKFDPKRDAEKDFQEALVRAQRERKLIPLDVGGEWCIWCCRPDSVFTMDEDLAAYLGNHYIVVKVNVSKENKNAAFLSRYPKIEGYPHFFVLDENGRLLCSQETGEFEYQQVYPQQGHDKQKIFVFLRRWAEQRLIPRGLQPGTRTRHSKMFSG